MLQEGTIRSGDRIEVVDRPSHGVTVEEVFRARTGAEELWPRLLLAPALSGVLRTWVERRLSNPSS